MNGDALGAERRAALSGAKLRALVRDHFDGTAGELSSFPGGAALVAAGSRGWVLVADEPARALGRALAWARQHGVDELNVVVDDDAGTLARQAGELTDGPTVWWAQGRDLGRAEPEPAAAPADAPADAPAPALALAPVLADAGADVVVEHGEVKGEVLGLEIATVVVTEEGPRIDVGVGRHDRDAFAMLHGGLPPAEAVAIAVATVRRQRHPAAPEGPLKRLVPERWLRWALVATPALAGAARLRPVPGLVRRDSVKDVLPAFAAGHDEDGRPVVVAASVGIDLGLVPAAADARHFHAPGARLVLVVPERDDHPVTRALAARLRGPAQIVPLPGDWRALAGP
ncbi:MAG: hypothetical protein ACT4PW_10160 [Acidimicrobiia bacterium]